MGKINARPENNKLFFDFRYKGKRCREQTLLTDNKANRTRLEKIMAKIEAEITLNCFDYGSYFPNSKMAAFFAEQERQNEPASRPVETPLFGEFSSSWLNEKKVEWRPSHFKTNKGIVDQHLLPRFAKVAVSQIKRQDFFDLRSALAASPGRLKKSLSVSRINHIMAVLRMIIKEAATRYEFKYPFADIKLLKVPRTEIEPFTLQEIKLILATVRQDYHNYYKVRFLTGMRTGEIDGLKWKYVDFKNKQILIRETIVAGKVGEVKNDYSIREIDMSEH